MKLKAGWVTVLMAAYNRASFLERSVGSCFNQEYAKVEVVVVDDGSKDETQDVLKQLQQRWGSERLRYFRNDENLGTCASLNRALKERSGEYFQFLDSDDFLHPSKIKKQVELLEKSGNDIALCGFRFVDHGTGQVLRIDRNEGNVKERLSNFRGINNATPLIRTTGIAEELWFNPKFEVHTDVDFFFRLFLGVRDWSFCPEILVDYFQHVLTVSNRRKSMDINYETYWEEARRYREICPKAVFSENDWMMRRLSFSLARVSLCKKHYASARRLIESSRREPGPLFHTFKCNLFYIWIFFRQGCALLKRAFSPANPNLFMENPQAKAKVKK